MIHSSSGTLVHRIGTSQIGRTALRGLRSQARSSSSSASAATAAASISSSSLKAAGRPRCQTFSSLSVEAPQEDGMFALILGKPGGGKGTISKKILSDFPQFQHLSSGDMLRKHVQNQTSLGKEAQAYMKAGKLVPDDLVFDLITEEADLESGRSILLDGFPRTVAQAEGLERLVHVDMVINLVIPTDTIVERISDRWIHAPSGRTYSYSYNPPKQHGLDDVTGEPLIQREDDKPECVRSRLETYEEATAPLVDYYSSNGVLESFHGTMSDVIYPNVKSWVEGRFDDGRE